MFSFSYVFALANFMSSMVTCTLFEQQRLFSSIDVTSKPSIPGGSTFEYCSESDPENDIFIIEKIKWDPNPPTISREQKLLVFGTFSQRIPSSANGTGTVYIPEWHNPESPASNYTETSPFCTWPNFVYQTDEARGLHKVCDGAVGANFSAPEAGSAILVSEDILFWPLPEGEYGLKLDMLMLKDEEGEGGERIFCFEGKVDLSY
ncbi:uncharacterized protein LY89DRAFT_690832 [Mollisia scopiformis]|uniref:Uncharacterized protein n=1 Tax=Mollisia scopiformis TaxID=149040 RepID=A0A132B911_MOLSC|nr:uncharacterized protein LY89DRAFT_690832 [Mollisia scopiformis]KUJ08861.1 hypothetical protein LY89DRAFT_690832 [Mollisia scopiformis]